MFIPVEEEAFQHRDGKRHPLSLALSLSNTDRLSELSTLIQNSLTPTFQTSVSEFLHMSSIKETSHCVNNTFGKILVYFTDRSEGCLSYPYPRPNNPGSADTEGPSFSLVREL